MPRSRRTAKPPPLPAYLRGVKRRRYGIGFAAVVGLVLLVVADRSGLLLYQADDWRFDDARVVVTEVIDGDTLDVRIEGDPQRTARIRLWGIDTPELARAGGPPAEPFADEATRFVRRAVTGQPVRLHLQAHRLRGEHGRLLAYVRLADGTILNERLLVAGLARADDRWHHEHRDRYGLLEKQARHDKAGIWSADAD